MTHHLSFAESFITLIYRDRHMLLTQEQDDYPDMKSAAYELRRLTGLSQEQIAARLGMMTNQFALIEKRGSPIDIPDIIRMRDLAWEYSLFKMFVYFDKQSLLYREKLRPNRRRRQSA